MSAAGVTIKEVDLSTRVPSFPGVYGGIVIPATRGPVNTPMLVTSDTQLLKLFTPNERVEVGNDLSYFSAINYLNKSDKLWVVRAAKQALSGGASIKTAVSLYNSFALATGLADPSAYMFDSNPDVPAVAASAIAQGITFTAVTPGIAGNSISLVFNGVATLQTIVDAWNTAHPTNTVSFTGQVGTFVPTSTTVALTGGANAISSVDECFLLYQWNPGVWGNDVAVKVTTYATNPDYVKESGAFVIDVFKRGNTNVPVESFVCSRVPGAKDGYGRNIYIEDALQASSYIRAFDNVAIPSSVGPKDVATALYLAGGSDGLAVTDAEMIAAADTLSNPADLYVTVLLDGGWTTVNFQQALDTIAQSRQDCVCCLSTPFAKEASATYLQDIIDYRKTELNLNSSYSALYTPHALVYDKFNDRKIYVAPDGYAGAAICYSAANYEIWFPPAGYKRGVITVNDLRRRFSKGEMDALYDAGINPFRFSPGKGIAIWGQKTLSSRPSSLDRLNVRLLLIVIEPAVAALLEDFTFDFNDVATRSLITAKVEDYMAGIKARRGVYDFKVVCDSTNNDSTVIDQNQLYCDLYVKPTKSAEDIVFRVVLVSTGLNFDQISV